MCGRFTQRTSPQELADQFDAVEPPDLPPRYNVAPTQWVAAVRVLSDDSRRRFPLLRWGLIPAWAKDAKIASSLINARSETVAEKPAFRSAFKKRRCLIPVDGFYEWKREGKAKQPYLIGLRDGRPFGFAGLWETWNDPTGSPVETFTVLTTTANELMQTIHDRMPVIVAPEHYSRWLDPALQQADRLADLLGPYPSELMQALPVSSRVNNARHDAPDCIEPLAQ